MAKKKVKQSAVEEEATPSRVVDLNAMNDEELDAFIDSAPPEFVVEFREALLAASARDANNAKAVCDFGELVFGKVAAKHHREWLEEETQSNRVCIQAPPSSAKTTWITIIKTAWFIGKHPEKSNAICSAADDAAEDMAKAIADTIELNPNWKKVFPHIIPHPAKGWSANGYHVRDARYTVEEWEKVIGGDKNPTFLGGGVGSKRFNGLRVTGRFVMDDGHDRKSKTSDADCKGVVDFLKDTAEPRVEGGSLTIIQTRWNPKDVVNHCETLKRDDGTSIYKVFKHPALTEAGESYWEEVRPLKELEDTRLIVGEIDFQLIYLGNDTATQGQILKAEALRWYPYLQIKSEWERYFGVDFAMKLQELSAADEAKHSRFAVAILAYNGRHLVLEDGYVGVIYAGEAEETFFSLADLHRPVRCGIEVNAQNRRFYNDLTARKITSGRAWLNLMKVDTTQNMGARMAEMEPDFRLGTIMVSDSGLPFLDEFKAEWLGFGNKGVRNDTLSAAHLARHAAYNLLPRESPEQIRRRQNAKTPLSIGQQIEAAYGLR